MQSSKRVKNRANNSSVLRNFTKYSFVAIIQIERLLGQYNSTPEFQSNAAIIWLIDVSEEVWVRWQMLRKNKMRTVLRYFSAKLPNIAVPKVLQNLSYEKDLAVRQIVVNQIEDLKLDILKREDSPVVFDDSRNQIARYVLLRARRNSRSDIEVPASQIDKNLGLRKGVQERIYRTYVSTYDS